MDITLKKSMFFNLNNEIFTFSTRKHHLLTFLTGIEFDDFDGKVFSCIAKGLQATQQYHHSVKEHHTRNMSISMRWVLSECLSIDDIPFN